MKLHISPYSSWDEIINNISYEFDFDSDKDIESNKANFKVLKKLDTDINNDKDFQIRLNILKNDNSINKIKEIIEEDKILNHIFIGGYNIFDTESYEEFNSIIEKINLIEKAFKIKDKDPQKVKKWIKIGLELHKDLDDCYFCGNKNIKDKLIQWKSNLENDCLVKKEILLKNLKQKQESLDKILKTKDIFKDTIPIIIETCKKLNEEINNIIDAIINNQIISISKIEIKSDNIWEDRKDNINDARNYYLNKNLSDNVYYKIFFDHFIKYIDELKKQSILKNKAYADKTSEKINEMLKRLSFNKEINVNVDKRVLDDQYIFSLILLPHLFLLQSEYSLHIILFLGLYH